jgi:hypothetical protein
LPSFNTVTGIPFINMNLKTSEGRNIPWNPDYSPISEIGSIQLEFKYLSKLISNPIYYYKVEKIIDLIKSTNPPLKGLCLLLNFFFNFFFLILILF